LGKGPRFRVPYRRRREGKTDYHARRILATSGAPRFVVRVSNRHVGIQLVEAHIPGDRVLASATSHDLAKLGWKASGKNIPAAYLVGFLAGKRALAAGVERAYLDIGLKRHTLGNKVYAAAKGAIDAGLAIPMDPDIAPSLEAIRGEVIAKYAETGLDPIEYEKRFSVYLRRGLRPEALPSHFDEVKARIEEISVE